VITVTTRLLAAEGREDELEGTLLAICGTSLASPGCDRSEVSKSAHNSRRFLLLARFADADAQAAHANSESFAQALPALMDCLEGLPDIEVYEDL